jgi:WD40 repeat protein
MTHTYIRLLNEASFEVIRTYKSESSIYSLCFNNDETIIFIGASDTYIYLLNAMSFELINKRIYTGG